MSRVGKKPVPIPAGVTVSVADGMAEVKAAAQFVTKSPGGRGAIREVVEMILRAQGKWSAFLNHYSE